MIIRTNMATRDQDEYLRVPKLSQREQRRLKYTKHPEGKQSPEEPSTEEKKIIEPLNEEVQVRVQEVQEEKQVEEKKQEPKKEAVATVQIVGETSEKIAEPGTAIIRSRALDELQQNKPRKKYKVISLGKV